MGWFEWAARSEAEIEAEIADELEFHLEQRTRALVEEGLEVAEARAEAERRFGSLERVRQRCRWVQLGERIMLQRIQLALSLVLVVAVIALGWNLWRGNQSTQEQLQKLASLMEARAQAPVSESPRGPNETERALEPFRNAKDPGAAGALAEQLTGLEPSLGRTRMELGWSHVADPNARIAMLAPFLAGGGHNYAVDVLHLAASDPAASVREQAFRCLKVYAWQDFSSKPLAAYQEWYSRVRGTGAVNSVRVSMLAYRDRLKLLAGSGLRRELEFLDGIDLAPTNARGYDLLSELWGQVGADAGDWIQSDDADMRLAGLRFAAHFKLDKQFVVERVLPGMTRARLNDKSVALATCRAIAACGQVRAAMEKYGREQARTEALTHTSEQGVLRLLRLCVEDDSPEVRTTVGDGVLAPSFLLPADPKRGPAEWLSWWKENRKLFPPSGPDFEDARWLDAR